MGPVVLGHPSHSRSFYLHLPAPCVPEVEAGHCQALAKPAQLDPAAANPILPLSRATRWMTC